MHGKLVGVPISRLIVVLAIGFLFAALGRGMARWNDLRRGPRIDISPLVIDFGEVTINRAVEAKVRIRNVGGKRLLITDIKSSCQCTVADLPLRVIVPDGSTELSVALRAREIGRISQFVTISTDASESPVRVIRLTALCR